ncbi:2-polyprenyl-6-methoxyphenol hydroxylase-like oxidoreductase [Mycobacterium dioxanotrophicus]|uniref:2-polyprenyl-6-methoxyphenol hydroxylase-like oxidoreductase n=1 Tax=Mycobacterium dioxanotrophicus TaxID=482462 RepID=A0A1Y0CAM2_9MYCO|nr:FAD-dependent monooxygenase [Mycobacterium dioxanotrophicus]ART72084.1 2-polyprenyl-6-methoxyphenol hydroxylase-like oxidoreductase [Mycobacterium dioxanotrophicus]
MAKLGEHALVLGGSISGLLAARVLSDFYDTVTVVERDELSETPNNRRGVPQGRHVHALLARGAQTVGEFFPGILDELAAAGAPVWDDGDLSRFYISYGGHLMRRIGQAPGTPADYKELALYQPSRPLLECHVRRRLQAMGNVTIRDGHDVAELTATADRSRITGARIAAHDGGDEQQVTADFVVDARGRGAPTPACLERLGYGRPAEDRIVMHTTYVSQTLRIPPGTLEEMLVIIGPVPGRPSGMFLFRYEKDVWIFTVFGMVGREPPRDLPGMLAYADEFAPPRLVAAVRAGEPIAPVVQHRLPSSQWRRYDRMQRFPAGLLVCGDAMCSFNPIYGQGMSVAAMDAVALRDALHGGTADLSRRYFRAAAKSIGVAWSLAAGSDLAFPEVEGHRTPSMRAANRFVQRVLTACETDAEVHAQFFKVTGLVDAPTRLFHPTFLYRVARANVRSHQHDSRSKQADLARVGE